MSIPTTLSTHCPYPPACLLTSPHYEPTVTLSLSYKLTFSKDMKQGVSDEL
jgi:hypothetical protein